MKPLRFRLSVSSTHDLLSSKSRIKSWFWHCSFRLNNTKIHAWTWLCVQQMAGLLGCWEKTERDSVHRLQSASEAGQQWSDWAVCAPESISPHWSECVCFPQSFNRNLPRSDVFGPWELLDALNKQNQELGLIIDLTFTTRYYNLQVNTHTPHRDGLMFEVSHMTLVQMKVCVNLIFSWFCFVCVCLGHSRVTVVCEDLHGRSWGPQWRYDPELQTHCVQVSPRQRE